MDRDIKVFYRNNILLTIGIEKAVYHFRIQNYDAALRSTTDIINLLGFYLEFITAKANYFRECRRMISQEQLIGVFKEILAAQENRDYILLSDLYELKVLPFLSETQSFLYGKEGIEISDYFKANIAVLEQRETVLAAALKALPDTSEMVPQGYAIEPSTSGLMTLAVYEDGKQYYLHSKRNPSMEAFHLVRSWYVNHKIKYVVYGLGLGYHILEMLSMNENITIEVFESDINILRFAYTFTDLNSLIINPDVTITYDPDCSKLSARLKQMDADTEFLLYYPSLRNIKNIPVREKLENYFIQYSSIKNQQQTMESNFQYNIRHFDALVDELLGKFQGKDLYIIAAGPSLDRNFRKIKEVDREKSIVLATGTVYRKLLEAGIIPDYFIVTDANSRVYGQISGMEDGTVPMLFLSTAYYKFSGNYKGRKYLICQEGYHKAVQYAGEHGCCLYQTGGSVSTTALDIGITFGCRRIIFLGLDLAYTENYAHASGTSRRNTVQLQDMLKVEDIHVDLINTSRSLDMYRVWIEKRIRDVKVIEFIDATEGGAKIEGMRIAKLKEVIEGLL